MIRWPLLCLTAVLTVGCDGRHTGTPPATGPAGETTRPAAARPLSAVELVYGIYLARIEVRTTVTPDGLLRCVRTANKSYGPTDMSPAMQRVEVRAGQLSAGQRDDLARLFDGFDRLSDQPYGGVSDGGETRLRYGTKTVVGGSAIPSQAAEIVAWLNTAAAAMPVVGP